MRRSAFATVQRVAGAIAIAMTASASALFASQHAPTPVSTLEPRARFTAHRSRALGRTRDTVPAAGASVVSETFSGSTTVPNLWLATGDTCLTAGTSTAPSTSIPACGSNAPVDANGSGALQLTPSANSSGGMVLYRTPLVTARGLQIAFTDYAFDGSTPQGADGLALFLADASQAIPSTQGPLLNTLGYSVPSAYLGIGFDEYGNFSTAASGASGSGFPGRTPESIAVRGAASTNYQYIGGVTSNGVAASLPFSIDQPAAATRPANAPSYLVTLTAAGEAVVEADLHDGRGFLTYFDEFTVGVDGQPALPAQVYLAFAATTGGLHNRHQIGNLHVSYLATAQPSFAPAQIPNLAAWYDASDSTTIAQTAGAVSSWRDKSGHGNTLSQTSTAAMPKTGSNIDGLGALTFAGAQSLLSANAALSSSLYNESTVFVVTNQANAFQNSSVVSAGKLGKNVARYDLRLSDAKQNHFDFNNTSAGRLSANVVPTGPAFWTAAGSAGSKAQYLRKDGVTLSSSTGPGATTSGSFPLVVGANESTLSSAPITYYYNGQLSELLVYNRYLSNVETQNVEGYLACKWGMQNRLPADHPYRNVCPGAPANTPIPVPAPTAQALADPPQLVSAGGTLTVNLVAQNDANGNPKLTYNGSTVAPTIRLLPGDVMTVHLFNNLPTPPPGAGYLNDTNLHFHGLHVSPNAPGDDSIDLLALPGQSLTYKIAIPVDHPPGLYWYHSHAHGEAERQNLSGMSGALVIDGIGQYLPVLSHMPERILIARDGPLAGQPLPDADRRQVRAMLWAMEHANTPKARAAAGMLGMGRTHTTMTMTMTMGDAIQVRGRTNAATRNPYVTLDPRYRQMSKRRFDASDGHCTGSETASESLTLNGSAQPSIAIRPGEKQFWRMVNAGSDTYLDIALDNAQLQIVAIDGVPTSSGVNAPSSFDVPDYVLPPASRVEFIVVGPKAGGTLYLRTKCFDAGAAGAAMPAATLAVLNQTASPTDEIRHVDRFAPRMHRFSFASGRRRLAQAVSRTQTLTYSDQNTIDGVAYDPSAPARYYAQSGTLEEWTIVNNSAQTHTFHIHQIHFLVEAVNGVNETAEYVMDNVNVPAASASGPGSVKLLMDFTDPRIIGTFLLHCHILSHEDAGMMAKIRVGTAPPLTASPSQLSFTGTTSPAQQTTVSGGTAPYSLTGCGGIASASMNGAAVSVTPAEAGSCILSVADATGLVANISVSVATPGSLISLSPPSVSFAGVAAASTNVAVSGGTTPYSGSGCSGIANASINTAQTEITIAPIAVGSCTLTVNDSATNTTTLAVSVNGASSALPADATTFHHDNARSGWFSHETSLTQANVGSAAFGLLGTISAPNGMPAFGKVYAEPLYASAEATSDGNTHNLVIIATTTDQVYAIDDGTGAVVWEHNFTNPAGGITQESSTDTQCTDVNPDVGIVGTPVIDRAADRLFVVVPTKENGTFFMRLHSLSLASGADAVSPTAIAASVALASGGTATVDPLKNFNRSALLEANGNIYVALGSHCDFGANTVHGWLLAYNAKTLAQTGNAIDATNQDLGNGYFLGSIWMSGFGPAADAAGNVYTSTGNGPFNGTTDFAMSDLKVPGTLDISKAGAFTPFGEATDSNSDLDLGSGGIVLLPDLPGSYPHVLVQGGKCGAGSANGGTQGCQKYLLNRDALGGMTSGDAGALWHADVGGGPLFGGPAMFEDANANIYLVYGGNPLGTYEVGTSPLGLTTLTTTNVGCFECRDGGAQPIVSSNGTTAGSAVAWALKTPGNSGGTISLYAFNPLNMATPLFSGAAGTWNPGSGQTEIGGALISPLVANGRVYVPTDGAVAVFGLTQ